MIENQEPTTHEIVGKKTTIRRIVNVLIDCEISFDFEKVGKDRYSLCVETEADPELIRSATTALYAIQQGNKSEEQVSAFRAARNALSYAHKLTARNPIEDEDE